MPSVEIFTQKGCPFCIRAIAALEENGIAFQEINAPKGTPERDESIRRANGKTSVPQIFVDKKLIGGCDDLMKIIADGNLKQVFGIK